MAGQRWSKGGKYQRKNGISIDFGVFEEYAERLDNLGAELQPIFTDVMEQEGETVQEDTISALASANLPAQGNYSTGDTKKSVDMTPKVIWEGSLGEIGLGFDKTKAGAGGWLVTGTPKMSPDYALEDIYGRKKYERQLRKSIMAYFEDKIAEIMEG